MAAIFSISVAWSGGEQIERRKTTPMVIPKKSRRARLRDCRFLAGRARKENRLILIPSLLQRNNVNQVLRRLYCLEKALRMTRLTSALLSSISERVGRVMVGMPP